MSRPFLILLATLLLFSCSPAPQLESIPREVIDPPILPPPGVDFGNLSIWITSPQKSEIIVQKPSDHQIEIAGQVKYRKLQSVSLTLMVSDDPHFTTMRVYDTQFNEVAEYPIALGERIYQDESTAINRFHVRSASLPHLPAYVRVRAKQGKSVFYSAPCLAYHFRTQGSYTSDQLRQSLLTIVLQPDEEIFVGVTEPISAAAEDIEGMATMFGWANLLLKKTTWKDKRVASLIADYLKPSHKIKIVTKGIADKLSTVANVLSVSSSVAQQIGQAMLIQAAVTELAKERLDIIKEAAVERRYDELIAACDKVSLDLYEYEQDFLSALVQVVNSHLMDNINNVVGIAELLSILKENTTLLGKGAATSISGFLVGFEQGMNMGNVFTGKAFEIPFTSIRIAQAILEHLQNMEVRSEMTNDEKWLAIESYRIYLFAEYHAAQSASAVLEGDLLWEMADWVNVSILKKESRIKANREELRRLAANFKQQLDSFRPPIRDVDTRLSEIKQVIGQ